MALTHHYVDPSLDSDNTGTGIGDPWGDLEYLLETGTPGSEGNQINIKAGVDEILAGNLSTALLAGAFTTSVTNPLIIRGYTSVANDFGVAGISGNDLYHCIDTAAASMDHVHVRDLHIHSSGANEWIHFNNHSSITRCRFDTCSAATGINAGGYGHVSGIYVGDHSCTGQVVYVINGMLEGAYVVGSSGCTYGIYCSTAALASHCIVTVKSTRSGYLSANSGSFSNCVAYHETGDGIGRGFTDNGSIHSMKLRNCIVEGFAGAGGTGVYATTPNVNTDGCAFYNVTTPLDFPFSDDVYYGDNETLSASPFVDAANGDFTPVSTGNVQEGAVPNIIGGGFV